MKQAFKNFIYQIPSDIFAKPEKYGTNNIIIFRPTTYIVGMEVYLRDYHICLPTSELPPMRVEQREYQFKKGRLLVFTPETRMMCTKYAPTSRYVSVCINRDFFHRIALEVTGKSNISFPYMNNPYTGKLLKLISSFEEEMQYNKGSSPLMLESISTQIVIQILRETGSDGIEKKRLPCEQNYINLALEYMVAFYNANIRIEDICRQIHLSPYYFIRMFKNRTDQSPHEFLLSVRVNKAEEMLRKRGGHRRGGKVLWFFQCRPFFKSF